MREIQITQGQVVLVDDEDYEWLTGHKWQAQKKGNKYYARRRVGKRRETMHRVVLGLTPGDGKSCDHINGNSLDNRRSNLRVADGTQNQWNSKRKKRAGASSQYKGVSYRNRFGKWGSTIWIGYFDTEEQAARAYDRAARHLQGEFAYLNFPGVV